MKNIQSNFYSILTTDGYEQGRDDDGNDCCVQCGASYTNTGEGPACMACREAEPQVDDEEDDQ